MTCTSCPYFGKNNRDACIACSKKEYASHRFNTNELSNKGQTFESYDNHGPMQDDRDVVSEVSREYLQSRQSSSTPSSPTPIKTMERILGRSISADDVWQIFESWLCEFRALSDMETLLFKAVALDGQKKIDFGAAHGIKPSEVNKLFHALLRKSPTLQRCLIIKQGQVFECRGRKPATGGKPEFTGDKLHYEFSNDGSVKPITPPPPTKLKTRSTANQKGGIGSQSSIFG